MVEVSRQVVAQAAALRVAAHVKRSQVGDLRHKHTTVAQQFAAARHDKMRIGHMLQGLVHANNIVRTLPGKIF